MSDASAVLKSKLYVRQSYDFSGAYAVSFWWWGSGGIPTSVDFQILTETGALMTTFPDGPASWREVYLPISQFGRGGSTPPNLRCVTGVIWILSSPGLRKVDLLRVYEQPILRCSFEVRRSGDKKLKGKFVVE